MLNINDECLVFYIFWLRTMTESTCKILKLDWKTPRFFSSKIVGTLMCEDVFSDVVTYLQCGRDELAGTETRRHTRSSVQSSVETISSTLPRYSTAEPLHYLETTQTDTPATRRRKQRNKDKISMSLHYWSLEMSTTHLY